MNNTTFIPYQRLELKSMGTEKLLNIIRIAATNYPDTSLILTPRIDQSGQAYYWTGLRYGGCTELDFKLCLNKEIEAFILQNDTGHRLASIPPVQTPRILSRCPRLHTHFKWSHIPEQKTHIPPRKHSLLTGNQGCILDPTPVKAPRSHTEHIQIKNKGKPRYETSPCFFWYSAIGYAAGFSEEVFAVTDFLDLLVVFFSVPSVICLGFLNSDASSL